MAESEEELKSLLMKVKVYNAHGFIRPASLCLLVGAFNPFTFKVIIDMYGTPL